MPQVCTICRHDKRQEIDEALLSGQAYRTIANRFAASPAAVFRHGKDHLPKALVKAKATAEDIQADTLFGRLRSLNRDTADILREARESQNHGIALQAIGRSEKQLELEARLLAHLADTYLRAGDAARAAKVAVEAMDVARRRTDRLAEYHAGSVAVRAGGERDAALVARTRMLANDTGAGLLQSILSGNSFATPLNRQT